MYSTAVVVAVRMTQRQQDGQGKFVLMRDSTKSLMRLYRVPMSTFEDDDDSEEEWDGRGAI